MSGKAGRDPLTGPRRLVLTGAESTGKSMLAERLARHFGAPLVPEYAREYAGRMGILTVEDVEPIARGQQAAEEAMPARGHSLVVFDTDLLSTAVYARHYYGWCPEWLERTVRHRSGLYLLLDIDVPFIPDPTRGPAERRAELHQRFERALEAAGVAWTVIRGDWEERFERAVRAVSSEK